MTKNILLPTLRFAALAVGAVSGQNAKERHIAFTAVIVENHYDDAGNPKGVYFETYSVWPDGSTEEIRHAVDGRPTGLRKIQDLARGVSTVLDTETFSKTTYTMSPAEVQRLRARKACAAGIPAATLLGYSVVPQMTTRATWGSREVTHKKLARSLDCFPLYDSTTLQDGAGKTLAAVTRVVTAVMRSEPDRAELTMGQNFTERRPSEVMALHLGMDGNACPECAA